MLFHGLSLQRVPSTKTALPARPAIGLPPILVRPFGFPAIGKRPVSWLERTPVAEGD